MTGDPEPSAADNVEAPLLTEPRDGLPELINTPAALADCVVALSAGSGPAAIDAERAHGYRYSARAYLIQVRRGGAGTFVIDPIAFRHGEAEADLSALNEALGPEWILHAANQDLPCLAEIGLYPTELFDTELAGRLLGYPRVSLGTLLEELLGFRLLKAHSAADWSQRPIPPSWLAYAALDVDWLVELKDLLLEQLDQAGKTEWASQEFAHLVQQGRKPTAERVDPWRRTSGMHQIRSPLQAQVVQSLWTARDEIARSLDKAPGRILPDRAIALAATTMTAPDRKLLRTLDGFNRRQSQRYESNWIAALQQAFSTPKGQLPKLTRDLDGPPHPRTWARRNPEAAARLEKSRALVAERADEWNLPAENLITPEVIRRLAWEPPTEISVASVTDFLHAHGVRRWQADLLAADLVPLLDPS